MAGTRLNTPIPDRMKHLALDKRGYPIPHIVKIDLWGKPHYTLNDTALRQKVIRTHSCGICGNKLNRASWLVGSPVAAFHENGAFIDPWMHEECVKYALQVCPYLAAPNYSNRIDTKQMSDHTFEPGTVIVKDETVSDERPSVFVAVKFVDAHKIKSGRETDYLKPATPYLDTQFWVHGRQLSLIDGLAASAAEFIKLGWPMEKATHQIVNCMGGEVEHPPTGAT